LTKKGLLISPVFPPAAFPESHLMAKLLSSVPGYTFDVVTFKGWKNWFGSDTSFQTILDEKFGVIEYLTVPAVLRWLPFGRFGAFGKIPDFYRLFNYLLLRKARRMISENDYQVMITWSQPHSAHLVGLSLKASSETTPAWIAHFSDPWLSNPYFEVSGRARKTNEGLQRRVLEGADAITVTNSYVIQTEPGLSSLGIKEKVEVIPHSFLPQMYPLRREGRTGVPITLRYIGSFYGPRRPDPLFSALRLLELRNPKLAVDVNVEFISSKFDEQALAGIRALNLVSIKMLPSVSYNDSLELMQSAEILLIVDAPMAVSIFLPSKLVDYVGSSVPIFAFTPPGPSADIVSELGGWVTPPIGDEAGYEVFLKAITAVSAADYKYQPSPEITRRFRADENGERLAELIDRIGKNRI
jgi:hypothetical protein